MWLHRHLHGIITFAARTYYRVTVTGGAVPPDGPLLLVANHPNSLLDAALVALTGNRAVRFLARAPLFELGGIRWLVRSTGAIPIYRRADDPARMDRNEEMFAAAHEALASGAVIGIFPEGLSHSEPSLAPLKSGAARIAFGAAEHLGRSLPILPVGLTFRGGKERFRSQALVLVGRPIEWDDLLDSPLTQAEKVKELTRRIHQELSKVTVNLESWKDFALVESAEAVHDAEERKGRSETRGSDRMRWLVRMQRTAEALEEARRRGDPEWETLARDILRHTRILRVLGLHPRDLHEVPAFSVALRRVLRAIFTFGLALPLAFLGMIVFFPSHLLVIAAEPRLRLSPDRRATYRLLGGATAGGGWILIIAALLREFIGWRPALWTLVLLPLLGLFTIWARGSWREMAAEMKRIRVLRARSNLRARLLERQADLARRIRELRERAEERAQRFP